MQNRKDLRYINYQDLFLIKTLRFSVFQTSYIKIIKCHSPNQDKAYELLCISLKNKISTEFYPCLSIYFLLSLYDIDNY